MVVGCAGRFGPSTHPGVKFDPRNVRASHGLADVMQSFYKRLTSVEPARVFCCQQICFWSADSVSRFAICQQISIVSSFDFCLRNVSCSN